MGCPCDTGFDWEDAEGRLEIVGDPFVSSQSSINWLITSVATLKTLFKLSLSPGLPLQASHKNLIQPGCLPAGSFSTLHHPLGPYLFFETIAKHTLAINGVTMEWKTPSVHVAWTHPHHHHIPFSHLKKPRHSCSLSSTIKSLTWMVGANPVTQKYSISSLSSLKLDNAPGYARSGWTPRWSKYTMKLQPSQTQPTPVMSWSGFIQ